jgi:hypothetical protein
MIVSSFFTLVCWFGFSASFDGFRDHLTVTPFCSANRSKSNAADFGRVIETAPTARGRNGLELDFGGREAKMLHADVAGFNRCGFDCERVKIPHNIYTAQRRELAELSTEKSAGFLGPALGARS